MHDSLDDEIQLILPAEAQHVRIARLVASAVAAAAGFDVDEVAEFRNAVDELCATLLETTSGFVVLTFRTAEDHRVIVEGRTRVPAGTPAGAPPDRAVVQLTKRSEEEVRGRV